MRLTLRTLLAYLDDILEPEDAEQLARKISESEFASELRYRALSSSRKLDLSAPPVDGTGMGSDANTVADYLDNSLPLDQVPEFERVCLESDMSLAEVVSSHRILMMVLGEPAQVAPGLHEKMAGLISPATDTAEESPLEASESVALPITFAEQREARQQPDYVAAGSRSGLGRIAIMAILVMLIGLVGLRLVGPFDASHLILGGYLADSSDPSYPSDSSDSSDSSDTASLDPQPDLSPPDSPRRSSQPPDPNQEKPIAENENLMVVNRLAAERLLGRSSSQDPWLPVKVDREIDPAGQLLSLPSFHPRLSLSNGVQLTLAGYTRLDLKPAGSEAGTIISVSHGQLEFHNAGSRESTIELDLAGVAGVVQLPTPGSKLFVEVKYYVPPGDDPQEIQPVPVVRVICIGVASWEPSVGSSSIRSDVDENGHQVYTMVNRQEAIHGFASSLPLWASQQANRTSAQQEAAGRLLKDQDSELSIEEALQRQFDKPNDLPDRALAASCLAVLGHYDSILSCWHDEEYRSYWARQVALVRQIAWSESGSAKAIQESLGRQYEQRADRLYRLLQGYSPGQLEQEAGVALVEQLSDPQMDIRMLAYLNLKWMTGRSQEYRANKLPAQQVPQIQGWRRLLKAGLVSYQQAPEPLMVLSPLAQ